MIMIPLKRLLRRGHRVSLWPVPSTVGLLCPIHLLAQPKHGGRKSERTGEWEEEREEVKRRETWNTDELKSDQGEINKFKIYALMLY